MYKSQSSAVHRKLIGDTSISIVSKTERRATHQSCVAGYGYKNGQEQRLVRVPQPPLLGTVMGGNRLPESLGEKLWMWMKGRTAPGGSEPCGRRHETFPRGRWGGGGADTAAAPGPRALVVSIPLGAELPTGRGCSDCWHLTLPSGPRVLGLLRGHGKGLTAPWLRGNRGLKCSSCEPVPRSGGEGRV